MTSIRYDSDGHAAGISPDVAAWIKQVRVANENLLTVYESMSHSQNKELAGFSHYAADEIRYHISRLTSIVSKEHTKL